MMYRGFSTSLCSSCGGNPEVPEVIQSQDAVLYPEAPEQEKMGLAKAVFRALGFGRVKPPKPKSDKSAEIVREKKRKPIFDPGEMDDE